MNKVAYNAKTNWAIDNIVLPADMNRIEQGIKDVDTGKAPLSHTHTIANITGLQSALDGKASSSHSHSISNITGLQNALDAKSNSTHTHSLAVASSGGSGGSAGFMSAQEKEKLATIEAGAGAPTTIIDNLTSQNIGAALSANQGRLLKGMIDGKANSSHSHSISNVSGLQSALDGKASSSHIHAPATSTSHGFMSSSDKTKLDGISNNATETYVTDGLSSTSATIALSANQGRLLKGMIDGKAPSIHAHTNATTSSAGFMSTDDKSKLDGIAANANRTLITDSLTSTSTTSALSANQGKVLNDNLGNLLGQMDDKLSKPGTDSSDQLNLGYMPGVHAKGTGASDDPMLRFYSATGDVLGLIYADSSVTSLRSWSGTGGDVEVRAMGSTKNVNIQAGYNGNINLMTTRDIDVRVNGSSVALKSDLPNALDNVVSARLGKFPRIQGSAATGNSYLELFNNGYTRLGYVGYVRTTNSPLNIIDDQGNGIEFSTTGHFKVKRGSNTVYADVATIKVGTVVPSASSLEDGEIYIQY